MALVPKGKESHVLEAELVREEMRTGARGLVPVVALFGALAVIPQCAHLRTGSLTVAGLVLGVMSFSWWALQGAQGSERELRRRAQWNDIAHHVVRTACHLVWLTLHNDDRLMRDFFLYLLPVSAARLSRRTSFRVYLAVHVLLTLYRFSGDLAAGAPQIIAVVACSHMLLQLSAMKNHSEERSFMLNAAYQTMGELAQEAVRDVFECFCDASARLSSDLRLAEASETLRALLGRQALAGKSFEDFVHMADREEYRRFVDDLSQQASATDEEAAGRGSRRMKLGSVRLHLEDSLAIPVEVHVFHAYLQDVNEQPVYFVGVSESWRPKSEKPASRSKSSKRSAEPKLNFETGRLEPSAPLYPKEDSGLLLRQHEVVQPACRRRRGDSPINPGSRLGLGLEGGEVQGWRQGAAVAAGGAGRSPCA